jgi:hypothetical protein
MTRKHAARRSRNSILLPDDLPLFAFAAVQQRDGLFLPLPALVLSRRYGLSPIRARLVAEQAGFCMEVIP